MIKVTLNAGGEISPLANVVVMPYYPMPSVWVMIRAMLARNPRIPNVTPHEITDLNLEAGATYALNAISQANSDRNTFATTMAVLNLTRMDRATAIRAAEAELARRGTTLAAGTQYLATSTVQETLFMSILNAPSRRAETARRVLGGGYTNWRWAGPLVHSSGVLPALGSLTGLTCGSPTNYLPFQNDSDDFIVMGWLARFITAVEFSSYQGMALVRATISTSTSTTTCRRWHERG